MPKIFEHHYRKRVEFVETDMAGIVHFSNFFLWMEAAEASLFRTLKVSLFDTSQTHVCGWPRVQTACTYHAPLFFEDEVTVKLSIQAIKTQSIQYAFHFYRLIQTEGGGFKSGEEPSDIFKSNESYSPQEAVHVASGTMTTVFAQMSGEARQLIPAPIPQALLEQIEVR